MIKVEVKQIYTLMNNVTNEVLGKEGLVKEDLSNIVDIGTEIFNQNDVDNYVKTLVNHIGKVIFVNRPYAGNAPSVLMDGWEFGSVLEKINADIPEATENESWNLVDKQEYKQDIFYKPSVSAKFFNKKVTFEVPMSFTEMQVKESFSSAEQLNGFLSMIHNAIDKSMSIKLDSLIMKTINNMIGETIAHEYTDSSDSTGKKLVALSSKSGVKAVNLLFLYNNKFTKTLTAEQAITDPDFIRFASYTIGLYRDRLSKISTLFNVGGKERFTSKEYLHTILLSDFIASADVYLNSDTFHDDFVKLPTAERVPYWQGSGIDYSFSNTSDIHIATAGGVDVEVSGVIGVMFDRDALGVCNTSKRVTTNYNAKAEFYNNYYKFDASYFNDLNENFVVFFVE